MARRFLICAAFATCCFLNTWVELAEGDGPYYARFDPLHAVAIPVVSWELATALGMFGVWEICRRTKLARSRMLQLVFLACCLVPLGIAAVAALRILPVGVEPVIRNPLFWPAALAAGLLPLWFAVFRTRVVLRPVLALLLYSWPVLALLMFESARVTLLPYRADAYADGALAPRLGAPPRRVRVVWIIFDELSQTIAFGRRPAGLQLPNLDRLRTESFYATSAIPPSDATEKSLPALVLGRPVLEADPAGPDDLRLRPDPAAASFLWSSAPNVFDAARARGFNTAVVGWFHPYGRVLHRSLTECYWTAGWLLSGIEEPSRPEPLPAAIWLRARLQFAALPLVGHLPGVFPGACQREAKVARFLYLLDRAREVAADPTIGLALIHFPAPHPPAIYSRSAEKMSSAPGTSYLDSVSLADRTLGDLRGAIERAGLWEETAVLVSADHGWRTSLWRGGPDWTAEDEAASHNDTSGVPFMLRLPGQSSGLVYSEPFNTIVTRRIVTGILDGRLSDPERIADAIKSAENPHSEHAAPDPQETSRPVRGPAAAGR